jgi:3-hydroxybutyrate dehydrogenase/3-oxoacyl-[acyl-carrier protein] reductase
VRSSRRRCGSSVRPPSRCTRRTSAATTRRTARSAASLAYTTAKHGLVGFTKQLAQITGRTGITVNLLCPGWTNTSLLDFEKVAKRAGTSVEAAVESAEAESAQHRVLEPEELTGMATLLASDEGAGITGQVISVDGGYRL